MSHVQTDEKPTPTQTDYIAPAPVQGATVKDRAISAALWAAGLGWLLPWTSSMILLHKTIGAKRMEPISRAFCWGQVKMTGARWKAVVDPAVRDDEQYLFAQNHINHFDFVTMYNSTKHFKQGLELETHFRYPFYGWFMKSRGTVPVPAKRAQRTQAVREGIRQQIAMNNSVLIFPEGTRTVDGQVGPFRKGVFLIARDLGLKVIPTTVTGMYEVMQKGSLLLRPGKDVTVYCDAPVDFAGLSNDGVVAAMQKVRQTMVRRLSDHYAQQH